MSSGSGNARYAKTSGRWLLAPLLLLVATVGLPGCQEERKVDVAANLDPEKMPSMETRNVATFITDSGITQYKIVTPIWYVYDEADTPHWRFPKGVYLEKYDPKFHVIASVAADSARYFKRERLWKLDGNVEMHKAPRDIFLTQQLFWDERREKIYSDSFIHVENNSHILEGIGFESNADLTVYRVKNPTGIFPVENPQSNR